MPPRTYGSGNQSTLLSLLEKYMSDVRDRDNMSRELEVRFGTKGQRRLSKIDYDNVIRHLLSLGFVIDNPEGENLLRITNEYTDKGSGITRMSNIRTELEGIGTIRTYCETDTPPSDNKSVKFVKKGWLKQGEQTYFPADVPQFNLRIALSEENTLPPQAGIVKGIKETWSTTRKMFRYINRVKLTKPGIPVKIECSIVKTNTYERGRLLPFHTIQESKVFNNPESYEIELEAR